MKLPSLVFCVSSAGFCLAGVVLAQSAAPSSSVDFSPLVPDATNAPGGPSSGSPLPSRPRAVSPDMASKLSAVAPKFLPRTSVESVSPPTDLRETDRPKNGIVRLPNYVVREPKVRVFREWDLLTPAGRLDLAYKRRPGLRLGSQRFFNNDAIALSMVEEERRLERIDEMKDLLSVLRFSEDTPREVKAMATDTLIHRTDWATTGGSWAQSQQKP